MTDADVNPRHFRFSWLPMSRGNVRGGHWIGHRLSTSRHEVASYDVNGYPVNAAEYPLFGMGTEGSPVDKKQTVKKTYTIPSSDGWRESIRSKSARWRGHSKGPDTPQQQPITLTIRPPNSQKVFTIRQHPVPLPVLPRVGRSKISFRPEREERRLERNREVRLETPKKRIRQGNALPLSHVPHPSSQCVDVQRLPQRITAIDNEPGEILDTTTDLSKNGGLHWCSLEDEMSPGHVSFKGHIKRHRSWIGESYNLRSAVIPDTEN